jgi:uncharacterized protein (TIGR02453 family)
MAIHKSSFNFLKSLMKNNNREWFAEHKEEYLEAYGNMIAFADALLAEMNKHDKIETPSGKKSLFRIYRDVRFGTDKSPYHTFWSGHFKRATKQRRGGYYYHIEPGNTYVMGGFWGPEPTDMKRIRQDIAADYKGWQKMLNNKTLVKTFGMLQGETVISAPRGYSKDDPAISLLRHKQFLMKHHFTDQDVLSPDFLRKMNDAFKNLRPFFDFMSDVLTTDANGVALL